MSVLVVGSIALDDIKTVRESHTNLLGGSASYGALAASFFGPVRLVGVVGSDFPTTHRELFAENGIDLEGLEVADGNTFRWSGEYEANMNNRKTLSVELNVFEHFEPKLPEDWKQTEYVMLGNIAPSLQAMVLEQLDSPKFVVADTMDLWIEMARTDLLALLQKIDMLILNDSEATMLTRESNLITAGRAIQGMGPKYVAVKKGEHGSMLFGPSGAYFTTGAYPLEAVHDPTGAGDSFAGAFLGSLAAGGDLSFEAMKNSVVYGTLVASFCCEQFSLKRLDSMTRTELDARFEAFKSYAFF
ncbi:MAG: PfkB family carbohydrate kinase [Verrucomicrobiota bacterium]